MNVIEYAKEFSKLTFDQKVDSVRMLNETIFNKDKSPDGTLLGFDKKVQIKALESWTTMNILLGNEMMPPESIDRSIEMAYKIAREG